MFPTAGFAANPANMDDAKANAIPDIERIKREHRALAILRTLQREPSNCSNGQVLGDYLKAIGLPVTSTELGDELGRLDRAGLVKLETVKDIAVVQLTAAGSETAKGLNVVDGVLRTGPDCPY